MSDFRDAYGQQWFEVERLPQALDLSLITRLLAQQSVPHRITEEGNQQVIWVAQAELREPVAKLLEAWRRGELRVQEHEQKPPEAEPASGLVSQAQLILRWLPVTVSLLLLSVLGFVVVMTDARLQIGHWFTIVDIGYHARAGLGDLDLSEAWRLWTPMFLHFDLVHLAFNAMFLWVFGARMERVMGSAHFLIFVLVVGLAANLGQLMWENNPRFGGMSGVNYGFIGYLWLRQMLAPHPMFVFPKALFPFLIIMLLLGTFGVLDIFIQGRVANAAHITGFLAGASWGLLAGLYLAGRGSPPQPSARNLHTEAAPAESQTEHDQTNKPSEREP